MRIVSLEFCKVLGSVHREQVGKVANLPPIKSIVFDISN